MSDQTTTSATTSHQEQVEAPSSKGETIHISKPLGHVNSPALICGGVAALISIALDLMGRYKGVIQSLQETYQAKPFFFESIDTWHRSWNWVIAAVLAAAVAYVVMDSAGKGRRIFLGVVFTILTLTFSPLLMLWGVFWSPVTVVVAIIFAWIFAYIYTSLHVMPCELGMKRKKK